MMFDVITIFLVSILLLAGVYTTIQFRGKFPKRTIEDVTPFLRPAEHDELESLLDPGQETNFRLRMSPQEFAAFLASAHMPTGHQPASHRQVA